MAVSVTNETNWKRRVSLKCGPKGKDGFRIGNYSSVDQESLHISFSVEKSDSESANTAKVQIWNLSPKNLKILDKKNCIIELRAGYANNMALILSGNVETVTTTRSNADRETELEVTDGGVALRNVVINVSYNKKTSCKTVYDYIGKQMGMSIVYASGLSYKTLPNGFSFVGTGAKALKKLTKLCGHSWSIQNGVLQITKKGKAVSKQAYVLSSDTGLLGIPKRISVATSSDSDKTETGYEIEYLLNGAIGVNDIVRIKSDEVNGDFRVYKVTIDGDNMEGDWICAAQVLKAKK